MDNIPIPLLSRVTVLLLDIEGTTTPIDFVYETLFPYARVRIANYLTEQLSDGDRALLLSDYAAERSPSKPAWSDPPIDYVLWLMDNDKKVQGLKNIQGEIWEEGYRDGSIRGVVFPDVAPAMRQWKSERGQIFIYSSGSVKAQQTLFAYSIEGDLSGLIDGYFDTEVGPKKEASSYRTIASHIGVPVGECLFVSDIADECSAANEAGFKVLLSVRPGNKPQESTFTTIRSFDEIFLQISKL